jgi:hypothetical protein
MDSVPARGLIPSSTRRLGGNPICAKDCVSWVRHAITLSRGKRGACLPSGMGMDGDSEAVATTGDSPETVVDTGQIHKPA